MYPLTGHERQDLQMFARCSLESLYDSILKLTRLRLTKEAILKVTIRCMILHPSALSICETSANIIGKRVQKRGLPSGAEGS